MANKSLKEDRHHGDVSLPVSCYRIAPPYTSAYGPLYRLECHWHDEMELFKIVKGWVQLQCGNEFIQAGTGDMIFFNSGELHAAQPLEGTELDYCAVVFSPELLCGDETDIVRLRYITPVIEGRLCFSRVVNGDTAKGRRLLGEFDRVMELLTLRPTAYELQVKGSLSEIFAGLLESGEYKAPARSRAAQGIKPAIDYIRENYQGSLTIEALAEMSHMSSGHFCRLFKKHTFKTPVQYINSVRLSAAMRLLLESDRKVLDIAYDSGFNSLSYFIGVFKQNMGCTPTDFRRENRPGYQEEVL